MAGEGGDCQALLGRRGSHGTRRWGGWARDGPRSLSLPTAPPLPCATAFPCLPSSSGVQLHEFRGGVHTWEEQRYSLWPLHMLFLPPDVYFILVSHQGSDTAPRKTSVPPGAEPEHLCSAAGGRVERQRLRHLTQPGSCEPKGKAVPPPYSQGPRGGGAWQDCC